MNRSRSHTLSYSLSLAVIVPLAALVTGCSTPKPEPVTPNQAMATNVNVQQGSRAAPKADVASPTSGSIAIEDRIIKICGDIPQAHFAFDSTRIQADAATALTALARCFSTGPLAGKGMRLVGHADPRGENDYNLALGQRRAGSVAIFVSEHGVAPGKVSSTSRGAFDAVGTDEEGWAKDRRVDVLLAD